MTLTNFLHHFFSAVPHILSKHLPVRREGVEVSGGDSVWESVKREWRCKWAIKTCQCLHS